MDEAEQVARIEELVLPIIRGHGLELVDLEWRLLRPRGVLRLHVDKPGGVGIADCERLSREAGDVLDAAAVIDEAYDLEVSSPRLGRRPPPEGGVRRGGGRGGAGGGGGRWGSRAGV